MMIEDTELEVYRALAARGLPVVVAPATLAEMVRFVDAGRAVERAYEEAAAACPDHTVPSEAIGQALVTAVDRLIVMGRAARAANDDAMPWPEQAG